MIPAICVILKMSMDRWLEKGFFFATAKVTTRRKWQVSGYLSCSWHGRSSVTNTYRAWHVKVDSVKVHIVKHCIDAATHLASRNTDCVVPAHVHIVKHCIDAATHLASRNTDCVVPAHVHIVKHCIDAATHLATHFFCSLSLIFLT